MQILNDGNPEFSSGSLLHYAQGFIKAFELQRLPSYSSSRGGGGSSIGSGGSGGGSSSCRATRAMAGSGAGAVMDGVDYSMVEQKRTVARRLFIFLHSIDGENVSVSPCVFYARGGGMEVCSKGRRKESTT